MVSRECLGGEHKHCGGNLEFANIDLVDDVFPCDYGCHPGSKGERDAGIIRDPVNGWAIRNE
jgi:hypothetical protein